MEREISARVILTALLYADSVAGSAAVAALVEAAGVPEEELRDETGWWSLEATCRVLDALVEQLDDEAAPFEAARASIETGALGTFETLVRAFLEPASVYKRMPWLIGRMSRVGEMEVTWVHARSAELCFRFLPGYRGTKALCRHRQGVLSGVPQTWGLAAAVVEELECLHEGGACCRYRVRWKNLPVARYRRVFMLTTGALALGTVALAYFTGIIESGWPVIASVELVALGALLGLNLDTSFRSGQQQQVIRRQHRVLSQQILQMEVITTNLEDLVAERTAALEHEFKRLANLARVTRGLSECLTSAEVLRATFEGARELLAVAGSALVVKEDVARALGLDPGAWDPGVHGITTYAENALWVYTHGTVPNDVGAELAAFWPHEGRVQLGDAGSGVGGPLRVRLESSGVVHGVLSLWSSPAAPFSARDIDAARTFGDALASALATVGLLLEKERQATVDPRTGLFVYRHFHKALEVEVDRARRYEQPLTLVFIDLDDFKRVNDTWGHSAGDEVLAGVGRAIRDSVRTTDIPARFGGDEFAVLLPGVDSQQGRAMAERVRRRILADPAVYQGEAIPITVSIGIGQYHHGDDPQTVIDRADRALYQAKGTGKNRICVQGEPLAQSRERPGERAHASGLMGAS